MTTYHSFVVFQIAEDPTNTKNHRGTQCHITLILRVENMLHESYWLVASNPLKNISQLG